MSMRLSDSEQGSAIYNAIHKPDRQKSVFGISHDSSATMTFDISSNRKNISHTSWFLVTHNVDEFYAEMLLSFTDVCNIACLVIDLGCNSERVCKLPLHSGKYDKDSKMFVMDGYFDTFYAFDKVFEYLLDACNGNVQLKLSKGDESGLFIMVHKK